MTDVTRQIPVKVYGTDDVVYALVDEQDYPRVQPRKWGLSEGYAARKDVAYREFDGTRYYVGVLMHRFLMDAEPGQFVDHINGDRLDNRRSNLRFCSFQQNLQNRAPLSERIGGSLQSKYKGVGRADSRKNPWRAYIGIDGKSKHLGCFATEEDAARAYDEAAVEAYGEFAQLNGV